ncbi:MAG: hypothetical protein ABI899_07090 [Actinomycetota bacterium]
MAGSPAQVGQDGFSGLLTWSRYGASMPTPSYAEPTTSIPATYARGYADPVVCRARHLDPGSLATAPAPVRAMATRGTPTAHPSGQACTLVIGSTPVAGNRRDS